MAEIGIYEAMSTLRAVRRLRPDAIADEVLHRVIEAATWAPTGGNRQPWRIIMVKDPARKERLGELYAGQWTKFAARYRANLAALEPAVRERTERMLGAGDYLMYAFRTKPRYCDFLLQSGRDGDHGCQPPARFGGRRRIGISCRRESAACLPGRGTGMCAYNVAMCMRA